jgi:disulfide bond formation protein DsbB
MIAKMLNHFLASPRALVVLMIASIAIVGAAVASQYLGGLAPCVLCQYQRVPYVAIVVIGVTALLYPRVTDEALAISAITFAIGGAIGVFHVGVEQAWWDGLKTCGGAIAPTDSLADLRAQIMAAPIVRCSDIQWSLFGVSMAGYNVLASAALMAFAAVAAYRARNFTRNFTRNGKS